jgi:hypothetical protein
MRFQIDDAFATTLRRFEEVLGDEEFYPRMARELPGIERIELIASREEAGVVERSVRYTPRVAGRIPEYGRRFITDEMLVWTEHSRFDRAAWRIDYRIEPNLPAKWRDRFVSDGRFTFHEEPGRVLRRIEGEVQVRVAVFGARIERMLVDELNESFRAEAAILSAWLAEQ